MSPQCAPCVVATAVGMAPAEAAAAAGARWPTALSAAACIAAALWLLRRWLLRRRLRRLRRPPSAAPWRKGAAPDARGTLDIRRQAAIAAGGGVDHRGDVVVLADEGFDLSRTIFRHETGLLRWILRRRFGVVQYWTDEAAAGIAAAFARVPRAPSVHQALTEFMLTECDFGMEHADGSFMDHLRFCHDYTAAHYKGGSPRVGLLHSIMGVGTNYFPMGAAKIPRLRELLTESEMQHVEAFPSVLRLLTGTALLDDLAARRGALSTLRGVRLHRLIDNAGIELDAAAFWEHLNYHLIHFLDFIPVHGWDGAGSPAEFHLVTSVRDALAAAGQLRAHVDCARMPRGSGVGIRVGVAVRTRMMAKNSAAIGHSLAYELQWAE